MNGADVHLARRLIAPEPGWTRSTDVVVVGSGVAGLSVALHARRAGRRVLLVTKALLDAGSTRWAQGGIAAALTASDSPQAHLADTMTAGVGLCDEPAVRLLVTEGPRRVHELIDLGAAFDRDEEGELELTREGGHHINRVAHAGGDATGAEISRALLAALDAADIDVIEHAMVIDLLMTGTGRTAGITLHVLGEGTEDGVGAVLAPAVVLASGGLGRIYAATTNPPVSTGDGVALAMRAGADVADLEFVQFHPTVLWLGANRLGQQPLVSEAMRGEGAVLVDATGRRVMDGVHELGDLAPRDVVTRAMSRRMAQTGADHLYLDARALGADVLLHRFPTIVARCREAGIDPVHEPIPVAPAAHYASGGVRTDLRGRTSVPGLYACGEVACTGVHGANRLASNSLLEGLVFAARIAEDLGAALPQRADPADDDREPALLDATVATDLPLAMTDGAGVRRSADSLAATGKALVAMDERSSDRPATDTWEATNLHTVATALVAAAARREESRGAHWREEYDGPRDEFRGHFDSLLRVDGSLRTTFRAVAS